LKLAVSVSRSLDRSVIAPQDWARGRDTQLERGLVEIRKTMKAATPLEPKLGKRPNLKPPKLPS